MGREEAFWGIKKTPLPVGGVLDAAEAEDDGGKVLPIR
jgi:hypothetical protein